MTDLEKIYELINENGNAMRMIEAIDAVRAHLTPKLNPGSITMCVLDGERVVLAVEVRGRHEAIAAIRAACSHAWEYVGGFGGAGSRSPYWSCVRCERRAFENPVPGARWP